MVSIFNHAQAQNTKLTYKRFTIDKNTETVDKMTISESITVRKGATLCVKGKLLMEAGSKIIVERGGKLEINGGVLTSATKAPWQGILVYGTSNQPQNNEYQGRVEVVNGGTIENAVCAISTIAYFPPTNPG